MEENGRDLTPVTSFGSQHRQSSSEPINSEPQNDTLAATSTVNGTNLPRTPEPSRSVQLQVNNLHVTPDPQYQALSPQELSAVPSSPDPASSPTDAISRAQQQAATAPLEPDESTRNLTIRDQPIPEDESEAKQALDNMANQLRMQAQSSGLNRVQGSMRGRRDVRNTMFTPSAPTPESPAAPGKTGMNPPLGLVTGFAAAGTAAATAAGMNDLVSPIKRSGTTNVLLEDSHPGISSDATSINSSHSLAAVVQHPELTEPGLNASIVETVNTWFAEEGGISRSFVVGEVAMTYNAPSTGAEKVDETIRIENFQILEKVAANPAFVTSTSSSPTGKQREDQAGEYTINVSAIRRPNPTIALKYQLHVDPENQGAYSPLLLIPAWQIQEGQVSVIVVYGFNPAFAAATGQNGVTLRNVAVVVGLDVSEGTGRASSAMMKPTEGASFRKKQSAVVWKIGEVRLSSSGPDGEDKKLLVRFLTQGGIPKRGTVEVKFELVGGLNGGGALAVKKKIDAPVAAEVDPFADGEADEMEVQGEVKKVAEWEDVPVRRKLVSGKYSAA
jgi:F-BAR domain only protein